MNINCFKPVINEKSKVIILGTAPSVKSLEKGEYYGNPRNQFWKLIYSLFDEVVGKFYEDRLKFILKHNIAIWDVLSDCYREGSLDSNIKNPEANDFNDLFATYTNIQYIFFNGATAEKLFLRKVNKKLNESKCLYKLPSSSPARTMRFEEKLEAWMRIKKCLLEA